MNQLHSFCQNVSHDTSKEFQKCAQTFSSWNSFQDRTIFQQAWDVQAKISAAFPLISLDSFSSFHSSQDEIFLEFFWDKKSFLINSLVCFNLSKLKANKQLQQKTNDEASKWCPSKINSWKKVKMKFFEALLECCCLFSFLIVFTFRKVWWMVSAQHQSSLGFHHIANSCSKSNYTNSITLLQCAWNLRALNKTDNSGSVFFVFIRTSTCCFCVFDQDPINFGARVTFQHRWSKRAN